MNSQGIVLESQHISKIFKTGPINLKVLDQITLKIHRQESVAIIGTSGSGKSTLLHLLGGLDVPTTGDVWIMGEKISQLSEAKRSILRNRYLGFVYQFHHLLPEFNALENVAIPLLIRGLPAEKSRIEAEIMLDRVGLSKRKHHKIGELSGGERQRVAIARALVIKPICLLADEPTGNLDSNTAETIFQVMCELNQELKISLLIVTHDMNLAKKMNRILTLEDGRFIPA